MAGVVVNSLAIIICGFIGSLMGKVLTEDMRAVAFQAIGLIVIGIGIVTSYTGLTGWTASSLGDFAMIIFALSLTAGGILGVSLRLEEGINKLGGAMEALSTKVASLLLSRGLRTAQSDGASLDEAASKTSPKSQKKFIEAFVSTTILFGVGTMGVLGSIQAGVGDSSILYVKSVLDGVSAIIIASTMGRGVMFSSIPIFIFQGALALLAHSMSMFMTEAVLASISAVGGLLLIAMAFNFMQMKEFKVVGLLPAIFIAPLLTALFA